MATEGGNAVVANKIDVNDNGRAHTLNKSDEVKPAPANYEFKDEMTVLEMEEAGEQGSKSSKD